MRRQRDRSSVPVAALVVVALVLAACSARPVESLAIRTELPAEAVQISGFVADAAIPSKAGAQNVLALSGGGADGAFGAGVLVGWSETGKRPQFDIVTGVSTGAFMATLAFLGPLHDSALRELYTNQSNDTILINKGVGGLLTESLYDETPLKKLIEKIVTKEFLREVAAAHADGRRLYIATTNLDGGELVVWDMGKIATGNRADPVLMFQKILRASAAVPGLFPPVYIKPVKGKELRQAHVDGGVKAPVLIRNFMFETPARERNLYVVINGSLNRLNATDAVEANLADIGKKSITEIMRSLMDTTIYQGYVAARNSNTDFRLVAIPDEVKPSAEALDFNNAKMRELFEIGRKVWQQPDPWLKEPPRLERFERVGAPVLAKG